MTKFCVTAVRRENPDDDRVSELLIWKHYFNEDKKEWRWKRLGATKSEEVVKLLIEGHDVFSGTLNKDKIKLGERIEFILRITHNERGFNITEMPEF
ncbi:MULTISPECIES: hypothetical protein [Stenotrophomonas]|uniref:hypothetical protein n=1 Tax=Stenotrophomonas TaxID=40323 RepID=UPI002556FDE3|nr:MULTISPECIES: hypothetical protein [Stenotrophomonas]